MLDADKLLKEAAPADPNLLKVVAVIPMNKPKAVRIQFRYAFVVDADGLKVVDITEPTGAKLVDKAFVPFKDARNIYLSRIYAYVAAGSEGMAIVDIEKPEAPKIDQMFNAGGQLNDVCDIKIGMTNASQFAYVANGCNGLSVVQLTSPETTPTYMGWASKVNGNSLVWNLQVARLHDGDLRRLAARPRFGRKRQSALRLQPRRFASVQQGRTGRHVQDRRQALHRHQR